MNQKDLLERTVGKYILKKLLGEGTYSLVYLAERKHHEKHKYHSINEKKHKNDKKEHEKHHIKNKDPQYVACKIYPRKQISSKTLLSRIEQETKVQQLMHHPNIVQLVDIRRDSDYYYMFIEYCPNGDLFDRIEKNKKLDEHEAAVYFKQILNGLKYIHSFQVSHRDLKLENILIDQDGSVKISDFGISKILSAKNNYLTDTPCGSPSYTSPECLNGSKYDAEKSDIWSCGVILYAMTTGNSPWIHRDSRIEMYNQIKNGKYTIPSYISNNCADLIRRLMTVDVDKRITIEEALNHPFLKNVEIPKISFEPKYVSLRKVDHFLGMDKNSHIQDLVESLSATKKSDTDSKFELNFLNVENDIKNIENSDQQNNDYASIKKRARSRKDDKEKKIRNKRNKPPLPPKFQPRKELKVNNIDQNKGFIHTLPTRRSEQCTMKIMY